MHAAAGKQRLCHFTDRICLIRRKRELVERLLVAASVAGSSHFHAFRQNSNIPPPKIIERIGRIVACAARADDNRIDQVDRQFCSSNADLRFVHIPPRCLITAF